MSDPQNPNDPFNQPSANQPWGQQSANQPDPQPWGQPPEAQQPWGQQSANQPESQPWGQQSADPYAAQQPWGDQPAQPADQWGDQPAQPADQWGDQPAQPADQWGGQYGQQQADSSAGQWGQQVDPNAGQWGQQQADPNAGQWGQQSGASSKQPSMFANDGKGLFKALFDFSFSSFVTPKIIKAVYLVVTIAIGMGILGFIITAIGSGSGLAILGALIFGPLIGLIYLALARMTLELYYAVIRLSEDVHERLPRQ